MTNSTRAMPSPTMERFAIIHEMARISKLRLPMVVFNQKHYPFFRKYSVRVGVGKKLEAQKSGGVLSASEYEVFLSFRGPDTRQGFVDCLYHNLLDADIRVFLDEKELRVGKEIDDGLQIAIKRSKIYVPIFSKHYASSYWCLHELAHMVECRKFKPSEKEILPIFYDVEPRDVKLLSQLYLSDLAKHEETFGCQAARSWEDALRSVAQIKGWELKNQGYWEFIKSVTEEILMKLKVQDI